MEKENHDCNCGAKGTGAKVQPETDTAILGSILQNLGRAISDIGLLVGSRAGGAMLEAGGSVAIDPLLGRKLPDGYTLCDKGSCATREPDKDGNFFCKTGQNTCTSSKAGCDCHLFRYKKDTKEDAKDGGWEHRADPGDSDPEKPDQATYYYKCICVVTVK